ncbi:hypothetical protein GCM10008942_27070 [Rhizomicrobium electricum]|uniref:Uncharacterized protein n=1 Tax=Rhizomicrobium electricum TaxID=480070 RepID=A0ABN1EX45_9PROT|nr:hypothetical protein [Rhizomicrobium electricum]
MHAVEKISASAGIDGEYTSRREPQSWICTPAAKRASSQSGTEQSDPYWDAPRLTPTFVAHVMGQVYCPHAPLPSAGAAYRATPAPRPVVFDKKI